MDRNGWIMGLPPVNATQQKCLESFVPLTERGGFLLLTRQAPFEEREFLLDVVFIRASAQHEHFAMEIHLARYGYFSPGVNESRSVDLVA
jgi:hypothetical protein